MAHKSLFYKQEMNMPFKFAHFNFNVTDLEASKKFYAESVGLHEVRRMEAPNGNYIIAYLGDGKSDFELELTWLKDHPQKYDLGECEFHLALSVPDMKTALKKHQEMGCICFINEAMGIYFIEDPDGYWIEIIPQA